MQSGFARPHLRTAISRQGDFRALIEVENIVFDVRCRIELNLTLIAADVATKDGQAIYHQTLSQSS